VVNETETETDERGLSRRFGPPSNLGIPCRPDCFYLVRMEWSALASTAVGGMIAAGTGLLAEGRRWKREHGNRRAELRRTLYGSYLASLSQARHTCSLIARDPDVLAAERRTAMHKAFDSSNAFRAQMTIVAPPALMALSRQTYFELREFGDRIAAGLRFGEPEYGMRRIKYDEILSQLVNAMRQDLEGVV